MLPIVEAKITNEKLLLAELQARIAASQQRINKLNEYNAVADGLLQAAQDAKSKIADQEIISDIYAQLSRLFQSEDNPGNDGNKKCHHGDEFFGSFQSEDNPGNDGNGNQPITPAPQPNDDGGEPEEAQALPWHELPFNFEKQAVGEEIVIAPDAAISDTTDKGIDHVDILLTGQSCEWASPLASPLCCQMEDAPSSVLRGQAVDLAQITYSRDGFKYLDNDVIAVGNSAPTNTPKESEYCALIPVGDTVAYMKNNATGEIICCYAGFNNKTKAKQWGEFLAVHHSVASGFQLRASERLTAYKWEIKLWGMSLKQIEKLAESDLQKSPPSNFGTAPKRKVEPVAPLPKPLQIDDIEVGDTVRSTTVKHWSYVVLAKQNDGFLDCKRIGADHIRLAMHPASVELVSKAIKSEQPQHISIDVNDVPVGVRLERTDDALIAEYRVWAWVVVRVFGKPEVQQKCIGTLAEGTQGISARRPHGMSTAQVFQQTFDAIRYLMQGASLKLADIELAYQQHQSEAAIAAIPEVTAEQAKADLFGVPVLADAFGGFSF